MCVGVCVCMCVSACVYVGVKLHNVFKFSHFFIALWLTLSKF